MTIQEQLVKTPRHLLPEDQRRVLEFATRLEHPAAPWRPKNPRGLVGLGTAVTEEDAGMRREAGCRQNQPLELPRWLGTVIGSLRRERIYLGRTEDTEKKE